jgi:urea transport system ATP-binding protein
MGRNGVGKTTLVGNIAGHLKPRGGTISLDGKDITKKPAHERVRDGIALVPQGRQIFPRLTVEENLRVGLAAKRKNTSRVPEEVYAYFPVLKEMRHRRGGDLSGGQQQQLAIGRALVTDPRVIVLDEPTEGIQPNIIQHIGAILQQLVKERGLTVFIVEQYLDFVREHASRFYIMNRGSMVANGPISELHDHVVAAFLSV